MESYTTQVQATDDKGNNVTTNIQLVISQPKLDAKGAQVMSNGVAIVSVNSSGIAANYGFQHGDIVRNINGTNIGRVGELVHLLNGTNHWDMVVERDVRRFMSVSMNFKGA